MLYYALNSVSNGEMELFRILIEELLLHSLDFRLREGGIETAFGNVLQVGTSIQNSNGITFTYVSFAALVAWHEVQKLSVSLGLGTHRIKFCPAFRAYCREVLNTRWLGLVFIHRSWY